MKRRAPERGDVLRPKWRELVDAEKHESRRFWKADALVSRGFDAFYGVRRRRNVRDAVRFYRGAARLGHPAGWMNLALCYSKGDGVKRDIDRYFDCLLRAASLGSDRAKLRVACALIEGQGVARDLSTGKAMLIRMVQRGDDWAHFELARRYMEGIGLRKSMRHGLRWLRYGVRCGFHPSETSLGVHLFKEVGTPRAKREAVRLYRRAARGFNPHACDNLSQCYEEGTGVRRSDVMATRWLLGAVECNTFDEDPSTNAWVRLAERHLEGRGVARDRRKALSLLRKAAAEGSSEATRLLKRLHTSIRPR